MMDNLLIVATNALTGMMAGVADFAAKLLDTSDFPRRWDCGQWDDGHGWLHILSDLAIWGAYFTIPLALGYFVLKRRDVPFSKIFWLFGAFIFACGTTHLMEAAIFWWPAYRLAGVIKLATAIISWGTILALIPVIPRALSYPGLETVNAELEREIGERRRVEESLRRSEDRLRLALESAQMGTWRVELGERLESRDANLNRLLGLEPVETVQPAEDFLSRIHEEDRQRVERAIDRSIAELAPYDEVFRLVRADGSMRWIRSCGQIYPGENGAAAMMTGVAVDITDRRQAVSRFRELADAMPQIVWAARPDGYVDYFNERWYETTGADRDAEGDESWAPVLHPDDLERCRQCWRHSVETGEPYQIEYRFRDAKTGGWLWHLGRALPVRDEKGRITRWYGTSTNIDDQKRIEERMRAQARTLETLNRINSTLAAELDLNKLVQAVTDAGNELTGAQFGAFFYNVHNESGESYTLYAVSGVPSDAFSRFPMPRNTEVFGPTFRGEGIVRLDDVTADPRFGKNGPYYGLPEGHLPVRSYLAAPVVSHSGEVIGGLFFGHAENARFGVHAEQIIQGLAAQAAIAIDNARLYKAAQVEIAERERAEERLSFLVTASEVLGSSLDYHTTLSRVAELTVPQMADWCAIDIVTDEGKVERLTIAHADPSKVKLAHELQEKYPFRPDAPHGVAAVLRTGQAEFLNDIDDDLLRRATRDEEHFRLVRALGRRSAMIVPLLSSRDRVLGVLTFVAAESRPNYSPADQSLAIELARRAAVAVDNALLYRAAQKELDERRQIEESLRESEERMKFTLDAARVGTWEWQVASGEVRWSENMEAIHGLARGTFDGTFDGFMRDVHPDDRPKVKNAIAEAFESEGRYEVEYRLPDGVHWVEGKGRVIYDSQNRPVRMAGVCMDITERRQADEVRHRLAALVESSADAIVGKSLQGTITDWNRGAERIFGYTSAEAIGRPLSLIVPADRFDEVQGFFEQARQGNRIDNFETMRLSKTGRRIPVSLSISPIRDANDHVIGVSAIERDITEQKLAEENLRRLNEELRQSNQEMEQFVYTVSHDLKSPLVTISGFVGLLREDVAEGRTADLLDSVDRLDRAASRMNELINDLLQLSRIGRVTHRPEQVDVGALVREIIDYLEPRLQSAGATCEIESVLPAVTVDRVRFSEVFDNLLTNAIKYGCQGPGSKITIGSTLEGGEVRFFVRDEGPGIPAEYHQRIFGLFQRLDSGREGTGVGLAIVSRVLQVLGGRAWVESSPGQGATFWIGLPKALLAESNAPAGLVEGE